MAAIKVFVKRPFLISSCNGPSFKNDTKTKIFSDSFEKRDREKERASEHLSIVFRPRFNLLMTSSFPVSPGMKVFGFQHLKTAIFGTCVVSPPYPHPLLFYTQHNNSIWTYENSYMMAWCKKQPEKFFWTH